MPYITIIAKFKLITQPEKVKNELLGLVEPTRNEKGCVDYTFYLDNDNPDIILLYENWETDEDLKAHMETDRFKNTFKGIEGMFELEVHKLTAIV
ncbi:MAG: putative quinol monooxygenase [Melioribacteraceae bacterium]|nr:antibiotic biosynthesis monooxygenase [Melioribacteraceae bacterium]WKZ68952.1 MAG: putative quinol monooxygenase [Melioribacteraceae bacterium]